MSSRIIFYVLMEGKIKEIVETVHDFVEGLLLEKYSMQGLNQNLVDKQKQIISKLDHFLPLYDISRHKIILEKSHKIPERIESNYRFVDSILERFLFHYKTTDEALQNIITKNLKFIHNFDLNILQYYNFYQYHQNHKRHREVISCSRVSYVPHVEGSLPYYLRNELIQMGLNMKLLKESEVSENDSNLDLSKIACMVAQTDVSRDTILEHQLHIEKRKHQPLVRNFSYYFSYLMNQYLREERKGDRDLELMINELSETIATAPPLEHELHVYRFINTDDHYAKLQLNDSIVEKGFFSTSRNPFCDSNCTFGKILVRITIPPGVKGFLCMETYSYFQNEFEIVFFPGIRLKLISKNENVSYYHTSNVLEKTIVSRYEFELVLTTYKKPFSSLSKPTVPSLLGQYHEKNMRNAIEHLIDDLDANQETMIITENYRVKFRCLTFDSTDVYDKLHSIKTPHGLFLMMIEPKTGRILVSIEIGFDKDKMVSINYLQRFQNNNNSDITDDMLLEISNKISHSFNAPYVRIYCNYVSVSEVLNDKSPMSMVININHDFYQYLKHERKRFNSIVKNVFYYYALEDLEQFLIDGIVLTEECMENITSKNFFELYFELLHNSVCIKQMLMELNKKYVNDENPFINDYYIL